MRVKFSAHARMDLVTIKNFLALTSRGRDYTDIVDWLYDEIVSLEDNLISYRELKRGVNLSVSTPYKIFFMKEGDEIFVHRIIHQKQDITLI